MAQAGRREGSRRWRRRPIAVGLLALLAAATLASGVAVGVVLTREHRALVVARASRNAADGALQAALARAAADGVGPASLAGVRKQAREILAQPAVAVRLGWFDGGQTDQMGNQAGVLRALAGRVGTVEAAATGAAVQSARSLVDDYDAVIAGARNAGLDIAEDATLLDQAKVQLDQAGSPAAVEAAMSGLPDRLDLVRREAEARRAQNAAAAAASAAAAAAAAALTTAQQDATAAMGQAQRLLAQAQQYSELDVSAPRQQIATIAAAVGSAQTVADFETISKQAQGPANDLAAILVARSDAYSEMASARSSVQDAATAKVDPGPVPGQLDTLQTQLDTAGRLDALRGLREQIRGAVAALITRTSVAQLGIGKVIVISLAQQQITAYQDGAAVINTPVTTGEPALPTPPGSYTVMSKSHPWEMISPWPRGSRFYYVPSWVTYVLWFRSGGYGIHDAPWRASYGAGTEAAGSHGCVNVPFAPMQTLFGWADVGTRVIVR